MMVEQILALLPPRYRAALRALDWDRAQELRLREDRPFLIRTASGQQRCPLPGGNVTRADVEAVLAAATRQSAYSAQETLREGYVTLPGGHRIGVCGTIVQRGGEAWSMREVTSLNLRIAHDVPIETARLRPWLRESLLIIGVPGSGKTTLLRACIRTLSEMGQCVCAADERGELSAFALGDNVDVLRGCGKQAAMELLLRSMGPEWIAVDEISAAADVAAIERCAYCGVKLLASAHAANVDELRRRRLYRTLLDTGVFSRALVLRADQKFAKEEIVL